MMKMRPVHLLLIAVAIGIQAATDEAYLDSMIDDPSHDVGASAGRRGGPGSLTTSGSFMMSANRAGNDEAEFGEADEDAPIPQADLAKPSGSNSSSVGEVLDADAAIGYMDANKVKIDAMDAGLSHAQMSRVIQAATKVKKVAKNKKKPEKKAASGSQADLDQQHVDGSSSRLALRTPIMLASCKKSLQFQLQGTTDKIIHACVGCKPDAPLPLAIAKHGEQLIWACDANRFKNTTLCQTALSWMDPPGMKANHKSKACVQSRLTGQGKKCQKMSDTGMSAKKTCRAIKELIRDNDKAARLYSNHSEDLKLATDTELTSVSLCPPGGCSSSISSTRVLRPKMNILASPGSGDPLGSTQMDVERAVYVASIFHVRSQVFTVLSHSVRACGYIPEQPLQCLELKRSECVWSYVDSAAKKIRTSTILTTGKSGQKLPGRVMISGEKEHQDQPCGPDTLLRLTTSRKL